MRMSCNGYVLAAGCVILAGCGGNPVSGPPDLKLGRIQCAECGMIVNEDRCSSAVIVEKDGRGEYAVFDDLGCMLEFESHDRAPVIAARFVHDHRTREWIAAEGAVFLINATGGYRTPMGSGIVAWSDRDSAEQAHRAGGGEVVSYGDLGRVRVRTRPSQAHAGGNGR